MSEFNNKDLAAFKDVWVFCEQRQGNLMPTDYELISEARRLADELGCKLYGLLLGGEGIGAQAKDLAGYGADGMIICEHPLLETYTTDGYTKVIVDTVKDLMVRNQQLIELLFLMQDYLCFLSYHLCMM